jgi:hypothetical protein
MFSISLDSCEVKENTEAVKNLVGEINDLVGSLGTDTCVSLDEAEQRILEGTRSIRCKLLELYANEEASVPAPEPVACPKCDQPSGRQRKRERQFTTLCGVICVNRWEYECGSGHYHRPWDIRQRLKGRYTHRVAETMCRLSARLTFREASEELLRQGIKVSHTTLHKKVREWSKDLKALKEVERQTLEGYQRWYVSCDGCHTNSPEGWKETKVGCIYRDYPQLGSNSVPSVRTCSLRYTANRQDAEQCGKDLYALALNSGIYQEDIETQEVVFIGDGAAWIWNLAAEYFPNAIEIVDYMHAKSHLYDVAKVAFGETETEAIEAWIQETDPLLSAGNIPEVVARIRTLATQHPEVRETLERETGYFQRHAQRMRYQAFREKGYMIGSGVIESACKHVVGQRCKQASMRWTEQGLNTILEWRCLLKNGTWDGYWYPDTIAA